MKKFFILLTFWLACLVPSISLGVGEDGEHVTFSPSGCISFAMQAAQMAEFYENDPKLTADQVLHSTINDEEAYKTNPEEVKELLKLASMAIVDMKRAFTPAQHFQGAHNFCMVKQGNAQAMIEQLKKNLNLKDI